MEKGTHYWTDESFSLFSVPSPTARSTYFYMQEAGYFHTCWPYFTERTGLNSFLIVYTLSGEGTLLYRGKEFSLTAGTCFFINCMEYHEYHTPKDCQWEFLWLHFSGSCCLGYYEEFVRNGFEILKARENTSLDSRLRNVITLHQNKDSTTEPVVSMLITAILTELLLCSSLRDEQSHCIPAGIRDAENYLKRHFKEAISLDVLADMVHISKFHLIREFVRYVGLSPHEYQIELRISHGKELLKYSDLAVNEIARACGINQTSHFIGLFKDREHMTPLQFRKKWAAGRITEPITQEAFHK